MVFYSWFQFADSERFSISLHSSLGCFGFWVWNNPDSTITYLLIIHIATWHFSTNKNLSNHKTSQCSDFLVQVSMDFATSYIFYLHLSAIMKLVTAPIPFSQERAEVWTRKSRDIITWLTVCSPPYWLAAGVSGVSSFHTTFDIKNFRQEKMSEQPSYVAFFGVMGATSAMVFSGKCSVINNKSRIFWAEIDLMYEHSSALGAAYGTAKSGTGIAAMSVMRPELIVKSIIPVVMAGILAIYGLVVAVLIGNGSELAWSCAETLLTSLTVLSNRCLSINIFTNKTKWSFCLDKNERFFFLFTGVVSFQNVDWKQFLSIAWSHDSEMFCTQKELFAFTTKYFLNFEFVFLKTGEKLLWTYYTPSVFKLSFIF